METTEGQSPVQSSRLVLIADDEAPIAEALAMVIEPLGCQTMIAKHGEEALTQARARPPALVFTDLMMPRLDGAGLIRALRADAQAAQRDPPPIVVMTAAGMREAEQAGADAILFKPFDLAQVEALIARFLDPHDPPGTGPTPASANSTAPSAAASARVHRLARPRPRGATEGGDRSQPGSPVKAERPKAARPPKPDP